MISMKRPSILAAGFASLLAIAGCPGSLEDPGRFAAQFGDCPDVPALLEDSCAGASCHGSANPAGGLDLASPGLPERLAGKPAQGGSGLLVDLDQPDASVLYTKLGDAPPFGSRMPLGAEALDEATLACLLDWIGSP
jgi:hypothetical protein